MKGKLLIIDDEEEILSSLKRYLEFCSEMEIQTANGYTAGIKINQEWHPSVILTDISMPDGTGLQLLQSIKPHNPSVQVIIMTGQSTLGHALDCLENGASDYLMKPIDTALMEKIVKESLERYERWYHVVKVNLHKKRQEKAA